MLCSFGMSAMRLEYTISERDFISAQRAHSALGVLLPVVGGLLVLAGIFELAIQRNLTNGIGPLLLGVVAASLLRLQWSYHYRRDTRLHDQYVAEISNEGIEITGATGDSRINWGAYTRYVETKGLFLLYFGPNLFNIFPKGCFAVGEVDAFRTLVDEKIGKKRRVGRKGPSPTVWAFVVVVALAFVLMLIVIRNAVRQSPQSSPPAQTQPGN
jgi:hypothetical protein